MTSTESSSKALPDPDLESQVRGELLALACRCTPFMLAVRMAVAERYDAIRMDRRLPLTGGFEATRCIRSRVGLR